MIKRIVIIIAFLLLTSTSLLAQNSRGQIRALKTAFITNALELTPKEAEKFWPVYNAYDDQIHRVKSLKTQEIARKIRLAGGVDNLSESEATTVLNDFIDIDFKVANAKKDLQQNLNGILSSKKIIKLWRAELDFTKELLKKLKERRNLNSRKRN